jgi:hypothetical protein
MNSAANHEPRHTTLKGVGELQTTAGDLVDSTGDSVLNTTRLPSYPDMLLGELDLGVVWCSGPTSTVVQLLTEQTGKVVADVVPGWVQAPPHSEGARRDFPLYRLRMTSANSSKAALLQLFDQYHLSPLQDHIAWSRREINLLRAHRSPIPGHPPDQTV